MNSNLAAVNSSLQPLSTPLLCTLSIKQLKQHHNSVAIIIKNITVINTLLNMCIYTVLIISIPSDRKMIGVNQSHPHTSVAK